MIELTTIGSKGVEVDATPAALPEAAGGVTLWFRYRMGTPVEQERSYVFTADEAHQLLRELTAQVGDGMPIYLYALPDAVPQGKVLVHNSVRPARVLGDRGFRAWLSALDPERLAVCECDWAAELGTHYRVVRRAPDAV